MAAALNQRIRNLSRAEQRRTNALRLIADIYCAGEEATGVIHLPDVSSSGLYMTTLARIPEGAEVYLRLPRWGGQSGGDGSAPADPLVLRAKAIYSNPGHGVGVRFSDLTFDERSALKSYLSRSH